MIHCFSFTSNINWILAFLIGVIVGLSELMSRYSVLKKIFQEYSSVFYLLINGFSCIMGYFLFVELELFSNHETLRILFSGFSSLTVIRSSIAKYQIGDQNFDAGLSSILNIFLNHADKAFDQEKSKEKLDIVSPIVEGVDFKKAKLRLPITCFSLMDNVSDSEQKNVSTEVWKLEQDKNLDNHTRVVNLGIILANITGYELLKKTVDQLGDSIKNDQKNNNQNYEKRLEDMLNRIKSYK